MLPDFSFQRLAHDGKARRGRLTTAHGTLETPAFMPVGTIGTVKMMLPENVVASGAEILLANTYHLMLRPGAEIVAQLGGLRNFMNWSRPILTDSGGYQVMSLAKLRTIDEKGVLFRSHIDGSRHFLTPERSIEIQHLLDATITMALDECTSFPANEQETSLSMERSMRWAERSRIAFNSRAGYGQFGIVQGGMFPELRGRSIEYLMKIGFEGYAIGGLAVGEGQDMMFSVLDTTVPLLPENRPRYLMGVGKPADIVGAVERGIDMLDCVLPTRSGRTGQAFTAHGTVNIKNARHQSDHRPLTEDCLCSACSKYSRAYLHHLFRAKESLGGILLTTHNLTYFQTLMKNLRTAIEAHDLSRFTTIFRTNEARQDIEEI